MGGTWSKDVVVKPSSDQKRSRDDAESTTKKRAKTGKERRKYFNDNLSWKAEDSKADPNQPRPTFPKEDRVSSKKKVALLLGYNGTNYSGMQMNPGAPRTIEGDVFKALRDARTISEANYTDPKKVQWMRAARTDKGVHAAGNVLSFKMMFPPDEPDIVAKINTFLPDQIRVWGYTVTRRGFHAKTECDSRVYEYLLPTHTFLKSTKRDILETPTSDKDIIVQLPGSDTIQYVRRSTSQELANLDAYRIKPNLLGKFKEAMKMYEGTHNFHNYTNKKPFKDKSANRHILSAEVKDPILIKDTEWLRIRLHGQSFMIHQIRKMIAMALLVARSNTPLSLITTSFGETAINIPQAPAAGLLLDHPVFDSYNRSCQNSDRDRIDFSKYKDTIELFKNEFIYTRIFETEKVERDFDAFVLFIDHQNGPQFAYLNSKGTIPKESIRQIKTLQKLESDDEDAEGE